MKRVKYLLIFIIVLMAPAHRAVAQNQLKMTQAPKTGHADANGISMYYEIYGDKGTPLVLIHGGGSTIQTSFGNIIPLLALHHQLIAVELQAHGRTTDRDAPESFTQDAADVVALLKHLNISKANFMGFSNGGTTTLLIASQYPEIVNKIIPVSATYKRDGLLNGFFDGMQQVSLNDMPPPLKEAFLKVTPDKNKLLTMFNKDKQRMVDFKDILDEQIGAIKAPALLMVAQNDVITIEHTVKISKLIKDAQLVVLPGVHSSFIGEVCTVGSNMNAVKITSELINDFLGK